MKELFLYQDLFSKTKRNYLARMNSDKPRCMKIARRFGKDFWDGDRKYGYGGYKYDGRQKVLAEKLIKQYNLTNKSRILDIGCGKGYLLHEFKKLLPGCVVAGMDVSEYSINKSKKDVREYLKVIKDLYIGYDYDLIVSVNSLHNMKIKDLSHALWCMEKHGVNKYIVVESFRNEKELCNLQCWALTCQAWFSPEEWIYVMNHSGYSGDYEFIYFE